MIEIRKPKKILGHRLVFVAVAKQDASFILKLRTNVKIAKYLNYVENSLAKQEAWIAKYLTDQNQAYFIIYDKNDSPLGMVRLYGSQGEAFSWGSWLLKPGSPVFSGIESALIVYQYALFLGFQKAYFDVRRGNVRVCRFHERFGAKKTSENEQDIFYEIGQEEILTALKKYRNFLPSGIEVQE